MKDMFGKRTNPGRKRLYLPYHSILDTSTWQYLDTLTTNNTGFRASLTAAVF